MQNQNGLTLLEVLISLLLITSMLFAFGGNQLHGLRADKSAYYVSVVNQQVNNLTELMAISQRLDHEVVAAWNAQNHRLLPNGVGQISINKQFILVTITWGETATTCTKNHTFLR